MPERHNRYNPTMGSEGESTRWTVILGAAAGQPVERDAFVKRYSLPTRAYLGARWPEERWTRCAADQPIASAFEVSGDEEPASRAFDREWARGIMRQATELQAERASAGGEKARRRVELLQLRFAEGLPIREIAARWEMDPPQVQYEYKCARDEFQAALTDVGRRHDPDGDAPAECARLLGLLAN